MQKISAGLLMFRRKNNQLEFFLVHPGGPFYAKRDTGVWSLPKGEVESEEDLFTAARREFMEETGIPPSEKEADFIALGQVTQKSGKIVHAWAFESDFSGTIKSSSAQIEWPPKSGRTIEIPEVDRGEFFDFETAAQKIIPAQLELLARLRNALN